MSAYTHIAGYRLREHARQRQRQGGVPNSILEAALIHGREMKSKKRSRQRIMTLNRRSIRAANRAGLDICMSWDGLGVIVDPKNKTILTVLPVDRQFGLSCKAFRQR